MQSSRSRLDSSALLEPLVIVNDLDASNGERRYHFPKWLQVYFPRLCETEFFQQIFRCIIGIYLSIRNTFIANYICMMWSVFWFFQTPWVLAVKLYFKLIVLPLYRLYAAFLNAIGLSALLWKIIDRLLKDLDSLLSVCFKCAGVAYYYIREKFGQMTKGFLSFWRELMNALKNVVVILVRATKGAAGYAQDIYSTVLPGDVKTWVDQTTGCVGSAVISFYRLAKYFIIGLEELIQLIERTWEESPEPEASGSGSSNKKDVPSSRELTVKAGSSASKI